MSEISQKQLEANRENAKLGGVKTDEGKAVSRYNAIKHGLHERMLGKETVRLVRGTRETRLTVEDDGWGFCAAREEGEGLGLTQALAEQHGGSSSIRRIGDGTRAEMILPNRPD